MRFILALLMLFTLGPSSRAALSELDKSLFTQKNRLTNPGWESSTAGWTASGGTYTTTTTAANVGSGNAAGSWDSSSASQTLTSNAVTVTADGGLSLQSVSFSCRIKAASGTATHKIQIYDGTNVLNEATITSSTSGFIRSGVVAPAPSSGTLYGRLISVASNEPTIYTDDCYWGLSEGFDLFQTSQAQLYGAIKYSGTTSCQWTTGNTGGSYTDFSADTDCPTPTVYGNASAPATKIPRIKFASLPPGRYQVVISGEFTVETTGVTASFRYRAYDGTSYSAVRSFQVNAGTNNGADASPLVAFFEYTTAQTDIEFRPRAVSSTDTNDPFISNDSTSRDFEIQVYRFPTQTELAARSNLPVLPTVQRFTSGSGTYTRPYGVSYIKVRMVGGGGGGGGSGTTNGTASTDGGSTTFGTSLLTATGGKGGSNGTSQNGTGGTATVNSPAVTLVALSGGAGTNGQGHNGSVGGATPSIPGGVGGMSPFGGAGRGGGVTYAGNGGDAVANSGSGGGGAYQAQVSLAQGGGGGGAGGYIEALILNPSATYSYSVGAGGTGQAAGTSGNAGGAGGSGYIEVTEYYQNTNAPAFIGSVTSSTTGSERIERAIVNSCTSNGACTIGSQSSSWLGVTRNSAGDYTMAITSGIFSAIPTCSITCENIRYIGGSATSATAGAIAVRNTTPAADDCGARMNIICMGPR